MRWSKEEIEIVQRNRTLTAAKLSNMLPLRTTLAVVHKRQRLGIHMRWSKQETEILLEARAHNATELHNTLLHSRTPKAIAVKRRRLGVRILPRIAVHPIQLTDIERGYLAGMLDGEGSVYISYYKQHPTCTNGRWQIGISIYSSNEPVLEYLRDICRTGSLWRKSSSKQELTQKRVYGFHLSSEALRIILPQIKDVLHIKREQAELALEALQYIQRGNNQHHPRKDEVIWELYKEMKQLNKRGVV